ncbi:Heparan-sulfate 6-O-sulfotransferase 2 [Hondaea fermentalgiana]|uniref:Heparan-sulfate 6-O-sulfotransferase 2 n=1 Tax=Hondaea fermentalgiana TaxID=2315210 RepID=A0A2R5GBK3_9STRA|nr:Heparan-sulfate 6-O-sulfotransferase 2 [Hondaea fermentalgiana]|eukprot:GBG27088.1 Heparan-sulfate 6-O-sulfotransferase 2 [Hondaea fermentalgiana]
MAFPRRAGSSSYEAWTDEEVDKEKEPRQPVWKRRETLVLAVLLIVATVIVTWFMDPFTSMDSNSPSIRGDLSSVEIVAESEENSENTEDTEEAGTTSDIKSDLLTLHKHSGARDGIKNRCPKGSIIHFLFPHVNKAGGRSMEATFAPDARSKIFSRERYLYQGPRSRTHRFKLTDSHRSYTQLAVTYGWNDGGKELDANSLESTSSKNCLRWMFGMRDPVSRMVSAFYAITGRTKSSSKYGKKPGPHGVRHFQHFYCYDKSVGSNRMLDPDFTIEEWARLPLEERERCSPSFNLHVKYLAPEYPDNTPEQLEVAKARLASISWFYIIERMQESWQLFSYVYGTDFVTYTPTFNFNKYNKELSDTARRVLEEHNKYDIELYQYAVQLFEERIQIMNRDPTDPFFKPYSFECDPEQICWSKNDAGTFWPMSEASWEKHYSTPGEAKFAQVCTAVRGCWRNDAEDKPFP